MLRLEQPRSQAHSCEPGFGKQVIVVETYSKPNFGKAWASWASWRTQDDDLCAKAKQQSSKNVLHAGEFEAIEQGAQMFP